MKKNNIAFARLTFVLLLAPVVFLTACIEEKCDTDPLTNGTIETIAFQFDVTLSQTWYDFYDVEVSYIRLDGTTITEGISEDFHYGTSFPADSLPEYCRFEVWAEPKAVQPDIRADSIYKLDHNILLNVSGTSSCGISSIITTQSSIATLSTTGDKLSNYVTGGRSLFSYAYSSGH